MRVYLYSSQLAAFVGRNPHMGASRIFNKLLEKYYEKQLKKWELTKEVDERNVSDSGKIEKISKKIGDPTLLKKMEDMCKRNFSTATLQKERTELFKSVETGLEDDDKKELKKAMEGFTNKTFGTIREVNALDVYRSRYSVDVITKIEQRSKKILEVDGDELWLISKLDGMKMDGTVVEIKNRIYKLFDEVREYEWLQVQAYLHVYGLENAELVEYLKQGQGTMKVNQIQRDDKYWLDVLVPEMGSYFTSFLKLGKSKSKMEKYFVLSENEQNEFIKKMVRKEKKN